MAPFTPSVDAIAFLGPEDLYDLTKSGDVPIAVPEEAEPGAEVESEVEVETDVETDFEMGSSRKFKRESMYTRIFEVMLDTVLEGESELFTPQELEIIEHYRTKLSYEARYLLVRLTIRQRSKWHRYDGLRKNYSRELGDDFQFAFDELCAASWIMERPRQQPTRMASSSSEPRTPPDVREKSYSQPAPPPATQVEDDDDEIVYIRTVTKRDKMKLESQEPDQKHKTHCTSFALSDKTASLSNLVKCLKSAELKAIAQSMKVFKTGMTSAVLSKLVITHATAQTTLPFASVPGPKPTVTSSAPSTSSTNLKQSTLSFGLKPKPSISQLGRLRELIYDRVGKCIKIDDTVHSLFLRLNLIFFRSTDARTSKPLLPIILSWSRKRKYPKCPYRRTTTIFKSREHLLAYENALEIEERVDKALESLKGKERADEVLKIWAEVKDRWADLVEKTESEEDVAAPDFPKINDVKGKGKEVPDCRKTALERFEEGHILTRIVNKAANELGVLKEHDQEIFVLKELLAQRKWRRGKRGPWYDRLALVLMNHCGNGEDKFREALQVVTAGLEDPLVHIIYRPSLERRLTRLEIRLKVPEAERHICEGYLQQPETTTLKGRRFYEKRSSVVSTTGARQSPFEKPSGQSKNDGSRWKGKSIWWGKKEHVNVETLMLESWEAKGYKGFHSEGRIVMHIFTVLFFSILFLPVPGAFETPYQTGPMDLGHDTFFSARRKEIEERLEEIERGESERIVREIYELEKDTWALGARWDLFTVEDISEIVQCIPTKVLSVICRLLCEDYGTRTSGLPDLFVWNFKDGHAKFVEVKGPGDSLMENQKMWMNVLVMAGMDVEVCHVEDINAPPKPKKPLKEAKPRKPRAKAKSKSKAADDEVESEDGDDERMEIDNDGDDFRPPSVSSNHGSQRRRSQPSSQLTKQKRKLEISELSDDETTLRKQDIIVIDDSDDEDPIPIKRKREVLHAAPNGSQDLKRRKTT